MSKTSGTSSIHAQGTGPTITKNDPAKFRSGGGRKSGTNGVIDQGTGPVFTENSTHIPTMNADKAPRESKVIRSGKGDFLPTRANAKDASTEGTGGGLTSSPLKASYSKRGRK
ncbi:MAG TPA: hypothetical protein VN734_17150 [Acidobacteriaceae bacterium]|nr:hypothetical protein [Acidobacteriaceae bacterium]